MKTSLTRWSLVAGIVVAVFTVWSILRETGPELNISVVTSQSGLPIILSPPGLFEFEQSPYQTATINFHEQCGIIAGNTSKIIENKDGEVSESCKKAYHLWYSTYLIERDISRSNTLYQAWLVNTGDKKAENLRLSTANYSHIETYLNGMRLKTSEDPVTNHIVIPDLNPGDETTIYIWSDDRFSYDSVRGVGVPKISYNGNRINVRHYGISSESSIFLDDIISSVATMFFAASAMFLAVGFFRRTETGRATGKSDDQK